MKKENCKFCRFGEKLDAIACLDSEATIQDIKSEIIYATKSTFIHLYSVPEQRCPQCGTPTKVIIYLNLDKCEADFKCPECIGHRLGDVDSSGMFI